MSDDDTYGNLPHRGASVARPARSPWRHRLAWPALLAHRLARRTGLIDAPEGFRILLFHDVPVGSREAFRRFAETIVAQQGVLTPAEAEAWLAGNAPGGLNGRMPCLFSFDDGFASNFEVARDILAPLGIKALFFVNPGLLDVAADEQPQRLADTVFDGRVTAEDISADLRLMTWDQIAALHDMGHTIGAHGMSHRRLTLLAGDVLEWEVLESGIRLEARLGVPCPWFAYAFGEIGSISRSALEVIAGRYRYCRSGVRGINLAGTAPFALRADMIDLEAPFSYQQLTSEGGLDLMYREACDHLDRLCQPQPEAVDEDDA